MFTEGWQLTSQPYHAAHFACFPPELPKRCILAGTSAHGACATCGAPWRRGVKSDAPRGAKPRGVWEPSNNSTGLGAHRGYRGTPTTTTLGWNPTCKCNDPNTVPCVVLDPFLGSGTTGQVAEELGRDWIGFDANPEYEKLWKDRTARRNLWRSTRP